MIVINNNKSLIEIMISQDATENEFIHLCGFIEDEKSFSRQLNVLIKAANGFEKINTSHLMAIADAVRKFIDKYDKINIAFTVSHQREIELSLIFKDLIKNDYYRFQVFSNTKDAMRWLRRSTNNVHIHQKHAG